MSSLILSESARLQHRIKYSWIRRQQSYLLHNIQIPTWCSCHPAVPLETDPTGRCQWKQRIVIVVVDRRPKTQPSPWTRLFPKALSSLQKSWSLNWEGIFEQWQWYAHEDNNCNPEDSAQPVNWYKSKTTVSNDEAAKLRNQKSKSKRVVQRTKSKPKWAV